MFASIVDFGQISIFNYAAAELLVEFMKTASNEYFVGELKITNMVQMSALRCSNHIFIHLNILGMDVLALEKYGEYFFGYVSNSFTNMDDAKYELIKSRLVLRLEATYRSVADMGHDNANDIYLSNGHINDLKVKSINLIQNSSNGGALFQVVKEKFIENKRRFLLEFTNSPSDSFISTSSTHNGQKGRIIRFNPNY